MNLKSAERWAAEIDEHGYTQNAVERIREEMRQEIDDDVAQVVEVKEYYTSDVHKAILNAGKPTPRKGQLVQWHGSITGAIYVALDDNEKWGLSERKSLRSLKWEELCDEDGNPHKQGFGGPVFLKVAM